MPDPISLLDALPAGSPAPAPEDTGGGIPDAVLALPEFSGLLQGTPPAVWVEKDDPSPEVKTVVDNHQALVDAGFGFYTGKDGQTVTLFNTQFTSPEEVKKMDDAGKLRDFATPFEDLKTAFAAPSAPEAAPAPAPGTPAGVAPVAPPSASLDRKLGTARIKNLTPGSPTSGATPGQGRILNALLKQPV